MSLKDQLKDQQKLAMLAKDKQRLGAIRLLMAEIKQREVDTRVELDDQDILAVVTKMVKQRRDSISQFEPPVARISPTKSLPRSLCYRNSCRNS